VPPERGRCARLGVRAGEQRLDADGAQPREHDRDRGHDERHPPAIDRPIGERGDAGELGLGLCGRSQRAEATARSAPDHAKGASGRRPPVIGRDASAMGGDLRRQRSDRLVASQRGSMAARA